MISIHSDVNQPSWNCGQVLTGGCLTSYWIMQSSKFGIFGTKNWNSERLFRCVELVKDTQNNCRKKSKGSFGN